MHTTMRTIPLLLALAATGCGGGGRGGPGGPADGGADGGADGSELPDGARPVPPVDDPAWCAGRPTVAFWPEEVARLRALAEDREAGPLGIAPAELFAQVTEDARAADYRIELVPEALPRRKGDARAVARMLREAVRDAGFLRHVVGDDRHAAFVREAVLRLAAWPDWGRNDLTLAGYTYAAAAALDWFCEDFAPEERRAVAEALVARAAEHYEALAAGERAPFAPSSSPNHKASSSVSWGLAALVLRGAEPRAEAWLEEARRLLADALRTAGGADGGAVEGPGYGGATPVFLATFELDLRHAGLGDVVAGAPWLAAFPRYALQMVGPAAVQVNVNDAGLGIADTFVPAALAAVHHAPEGSEEARLAQGLLAAWSARLGGLRLPNPLLLRWLRPAAPAAPLAAWPRQAEFPSVGQAVVRTGWGPEDHLLLVKSQPPGPGGVTSHVHHDAGHLLLDWGGVRLLSDPGYALQGFLEGQIPDDLLERIGCGPGGAAATEALGDFTLYESGHNTLLLRRADGTRIRQDGWGGGLERVLLESPHAYVEMDLSGAYPAAGAGLRATRQVLGRLGEALLVRDVVASPGAPLRPQARFHAVRSDAGSGTPVEPGTAMGGTPAFLAPAGGGGKRLRVVAAGSPTVQVRAQGLDGLSCVGRFLVVEPEEAAERVEIVTLLVPEQEGGEQAETATVRLEADRAVAVVRRGGRTVTLTLSRRAEGFVADGSRWHGAVADETSRWGAPAAP